MYGNWIYIRWRWILDFNEPFFKLIALAIDVGERQSKHSKGAPANSKFNAVHYLSRLEDGNGRWKVSL